MPPGAGCVGDDRDPETLQAIPQTAAATRSDAAPGRHACALTRPGALAAERASGGTEPNTRQRGVSAPAASLIWSLPLGVGSELFGLSWT